MKTQFASRCALATFGFWLSTWGTPAGAGSESGARLGSRSADRHECSPARGELFVPAGVYRPFFKGARDRVVSVGPMCIDAAPVDHAAFLSFVRDHPQWRRSRVKSLFAEDSYLADWRDDLSPPAASLTAPVTSVSWFAANAFCETRGRHLPTVAEWERVAGADASGGPRDTQSNLRPADGAPFAFAMGTRAPDLRQMPLKLPGIWEWTLDFNSAVVAGRIGSEASADSSLFCGDGFRSVDASNYAAFLRYSFRSSLRAGFALKSLGFRCTREAS